jgi:hypothetical protein
MKVLIVCTGWASHQQWISDNGKADAAYAAIKTAMGEYDRFGNDKDKVISVDTGDGQASFRIETLVSVTLDDCDASENTVIERNLWEERLKAKVAARLAPAA